MHPALAAALRESGSDRKWRVCDTAGAGLVHIVAGLASVRAVPGRLQFKRASGGAWLIDDSYNANPSSVRAAIEVLAGLDGSKWLV